MHVEKNVCDSIIGIFLNIKRMFEIGVQLELQPQPHGKQMYLLPTCHTLSKFEKTSFYWCL